MIVDLSQVLRKLGPHSSRVPAADRAAVRRRLRRKMAMEMLEERVVLSTSIPISTSSWTPVGPAAISSTVVPGTQSQIPSSGRTVGVAANPADPNNLSIAAAGGGVWRTNDGGKNWTPLTDNQAVGFMGSLAMAPSDPNTLYAGTGEAHNSGDSFYGRGILVSHDGGNTWTLTGQNVFDRRTIAEIAVSPTSANTAYAAVSSFGVNGVNGGTGIFKTTDGGQTWTNTTASISTSQQFSSVVIDPKNPQTVYAAVGTLFGSSQNGVYKSTDGGNTWVAAGNFPGGTATGRIQLAIAKANPSVLYAAVPDPSTGNSSNIYKSTDAGTTWTATSKPPEYFGTQGWYNNFITVSPTDPNIVFAGGSSNYGAGGIIESRDGGNSWTSIKNGINGVSPHTDYHSATFDAQGRLLVTNDGGIWRLEIAIPGSVRWTDLNGNLQITQFTGIALDPTDPNIAYGGSQDNGTEKFNDALGWTQIRGGDGGYVRVDPTSPNTVYHTYTGTSLERSNDGGLTWVDASSGIQGNGNFYSFYQVDKNGRVLFGTDRINASSNKGQSWTQLSSPGQGGWPSSGTVNAIAIAQTDTNVIYAAVNGALYVTTNNGSSWTRSNVPGDKVAEVDVDPTNSKVAFAVRNAFGGGHVFKTTDGGQTWTDVSGTLPDIPTNTFALVKQASSDVLVAGNDIGVFASFDGGLTWSKFKKDFPSVQVVELEWNPTTQILAAGTHGRGMFETFGVTPLQINTININTTENTSFSGTVATLVPFKANQTVNDFTAKIDWGDGTPPTTGSLSDDGNGSFHVDGAHTYQEGGSYTFHVIITLSTGGTGDQTGTVAVANLPINASGTTINLNEGDSFNGVIASFVDTDVDPMTADLYTAKITWGDDGTVTTGQIVADTSGQFNAFVIKGTHVFGGGTSNVVIDIVGPGNNKVQAITTADVTDSVLTSSGFSLTPSEGTPFTSPLAHFTDADPRRPSADNYFATIDWGDNTTTAGTIVPDFVNGGFFVTGDHTYDVGDFSVKIKIGNYSGNNKTVATSDASVADAPITASGLDFTAIEGQTFNQFLATFVDADPRVQPPSRYVTSIDWGDGTNADSGEVMTNVDGGYLLRSPHAYRLPGTYEFHATISDGVGGASDVAKGTITVPPAPISAQIETKAQPQEGQNFQGLVGSFISLNPIAQASDFQARIQWGDGTTTQNAKISFNAKSQRFEIRGSKAYDDVGTYGVSVIVSGPGGQQSSANGQIDVTDAPLTAQGKVVDVVSKTNVDHLVVATFQDADPTPRIGEFSAVIRWGDGTTSDGQVVANGQGGFNVVGSHRYDRSGQFPLGVIVTSSAGSTTATGAGANVTPRLFTLTGSLMGGSASPLAANVSSTSTPTFGGQAEPGARVMLMAVPTGTSTFVPLALTTADASGHWQSKTLPLGDGTFAVAAQAIDANGQLSSTLTTLQPTSTSGPLIIDTQGPKVQQVVVDPSTGQIQVTLADAASGLSTAGLANVGNFSLSIAGPGQNRTLSVSGLSLSPPALNTQQTATLTFAGLSRMQRGTYVFQISAPGVTDLAGNPLDERYYIPFPGLYTRSGQNFVAQFTSDGRMVTPLAQYVPPPEIQAARQYSQFLLRNRRQRG